MSALTALGAVVGFLIVHPWGVQAGMVWLTAFLFVAASRAYNSTTDQEEDSINRKRVSSLSTGRMGKGVVAMFFLLGIGIAGALSMSQFVLGILFCCYGFLYTFLRMNARLSSHIIKNGYGATGVMLLFLFGAGSFEPHVFLFMGLLGLFVFGTSIVADLRDYAGDQRVGKRTLPTVIGKRGASALSGIVHGAFAVTVLLFSLQAFFIFAVASVIVILGTAADKPRLAHVGGSVSIIPTLLWMVFLP